MKNKKLTNDNKILKNCFVIIGRNEKNSQFCITPKNIIEKQISLYDKYKKTMPEIFNLILNDIIGEMILIDESNIINMISFGSNFFTYDLNESLYTEVIVVENNITTKPNESKVDNISNLPLLIPILFE